MKHINFLLLTLFVSITIISCDEPDDLKDDQPIVIEDLLTHTSNDETYFLRSDGTGLTKLLNYGYPIWMNNKKSIASQKSDKIYIFNSTTLAIEKTTQLNPSIGGFYLRYSDYYKKFTSIGSSNGYQTIIVTDTSGNTTHIKRNYNIGSPASSAVDDWIYFASAENGTNNIHRMKPDGTQEEGMTFSNDLSYSSSNVSFDGTLLVATKFKGAKFYLAIINTSTKNEKLIDVSTVGQGLIGYPTFSKNKDYIYFTATTNRNLYKIKTDGTGLQQLTFSSTTFHRAMAW